MADTPKENEAKYKRFLESWKNHAPEKTLNGLTLAQFTAQCEKSNAPRRRLVEIADEKISQETNRENADIDTMKMCEKIKNAIVADDEFGDDSALYESLGFVRKSERKSGLTRKKKPGEPDKE